MAARHHAPLPASILSRDGTQRGAPTGSTHTCTMEGCLGRRITVRWPDGRITHPCSKGMREAGPDTWQIG